MPTKTINTDLLNDTVGDECGAARALRHRHPALGSEDFRAEQQYYCDG
ncbi:MAG: hypothetical protein R2856_32670 [Caldilineaceae bacterium]